MKWIGQHIYDLIARYRSDVYLENISTGTIVGGGNLGLDSDNKIVKAAISGSDGMGSGFTVSATTDSNATTITQGDDLFFAAGTGITCETTADGTVTITNTVSDTNTNRLTEFTLTGDSGSNQTIAHGNTLDIAGGNAISTVVGATDTVEIHHEDTSTQSSVNNSGRTYIQDITLDDYGHVTGLTSAEETVVDTNTTYTVGDGGLTQNNFTNTLKDKLDNIEGEADITDATNVEAAGALMDSECSSLASVKALDQGVATGDSPQFAGINLGHASDTTFARSAAGTVTIEGNTISTQNKVIHIETANFSDDIDTTTHYIPFVTTSESTSFTNVVTPMVAPVAGKLLKVHYKANQHHHTSSNNITFSLDRVPAGSNWTGANTATLGTKVIAGVNRVNMGTADFTSPTSGTNVFAAGDLIGVSMTNSQDLGVTAKYVVTIVFELDFNSY